MPIARHLKQPTRRSLGAGQAPAARTRHPSARPCSGWGLPGQPSHLGCRCALTAPFHPYLIPPDRSQTGHRRYLFCGTFPDLTTGRRYRPPCPAEPGLSSTSSHPEIRRPPKTRNSDHSAHSAESGVSRFQCCRGSVHEKRPNTILNKSHLYRLRERSASQGRVRASASARNQRTANRYLSPRTSRRGSCTAPGFRP